jgi:predicted hotdog family 3-hydroxylacyl-ACP dehydratase
MIDIAALVPHTGRMVLLDAVAAWDAATIRCTAGSHLDPENPLRRNNCLPAICGVEYAAQAIAVHGALVSGARSRPGFLVSARDVVLHAQRLDDAGNSLTIDAEMIAGQPDGLIYRFSIRTGDRHLVDGRVAIVLA